MQGIVDRVVRFTEGGTATAVGRLPRPRDRGCRGLRGELVGEADNVVALPKRPRFTSSEVVLLRIRDVLAREVCAAYI